MRLWSFNPKYLDSKGLVAVWREGLLAKKVLEGKTKGYKNHPQLNRFISSGNSLQAINQFLFEIYKEARSRNYNFDVSKLNISKDRICIPVNSEQLIYEFNFLKNKLSFRCPVKLLELQKLNVIEVHPLFNVVDGCIEKWEKIIPEIVSNY